jgi:hypothetical protein
MGFAPLVSITRAIAYVTARVGVTVQITTMGTTVAALFAVLFDIMGGRTQRIRRGPDGLGETPLNTIPGHCLPLRKID